jgi:hypothetical protein
MPRKKGKHHGEDSRDWTLRRQSRPKANGRGVPSGNSAPTEAPSRWQTVDAIQSFFQRLKYERKEKRLRRLGPIMNVQVRRARRTSPAIRSTV